MNNKTKWKIKTEIDKKRIEKINEEETNNTKNSIRTII